MYFKDSLCDRRLESYLLLFIFTHNLDNIIHLGSKAIS
jgi:hypothetical protein